MFVLDVQIIIYSLQTLLSLLKIVHEELPSQ